MTTLTLGDLLGRAGIGDLGVLDTQIAVPVITGLPQAQGDLIVLHRPTMQAATTPIAPAGAIVVRAESSGGNTHSLHNLDGGPCYWDPAPGGSGLRMGVLTVPAGATAYMVHTEEHGANAVGPGTYEIRRQREQADEIRVVAD